jgi:hypothetical protein
MGLFKNKLVIVVIGLLVAGGIWYGLSSSSAPSPTASGVATETVQTTEDKELVETLLTLRTVTLDGVIFQDPAFLSLHDYGTQIVSEPSGRSNPFAPLDSNGAYAPASAPSAPAAAGTPTTTPAAAKPNLKIPRAQGL